LKNSRFCLSHDTSPEAARIRQEATRLAKESLKPWIISYHRSPRLPKKLKPDNLVVLKRYVLATMGQVRYGDLEPERGVVLLTGFGVLANILKK